MNAPTAGPLGRAGTDLRPRVALALAGAIMAASGVALWLAVNNIDAPRVQPSTDATLSPVELVIEKRDLEGLKRLVSESGSGGELLQRAVNAGWTDGVIVLLNAGSEVTPAVLEAARARSDDAGKAVAAMLDAAR